MEIYLDNAATTPIRSEVAEVMLKVLENEYGNPSSIYKLGRNSKSLVENARLDISNALGCKEKEIYFTSGGTESDNWAIKGIARKNLSKGNHIITSKIEHHAVLHTCEYLENNGFEVTYLDVNDKGLISLEQLENSIQDTTILISIMFANNEIGVIQPIKEIGEIAKKNDIIFHTDAVQGIGHIPIDLEELNIDALSLSGHKLNASKGIGALYLKAGVKIEPLIHGGAQEKRRRGGTENTASIVGLGTAIKLSIETMNKDIKKITKLREKLINGILKNIPHTNLNGSKEKRLPGNVNITFDFIEGESILLLLDMKGIYASSGSACTSGSLEPSHVLLAMGRKHEEAHGSIRFSIDKYNTENEIDMVIKELPEIISKLREMSPLYEDYKNKSK